jgi:hypothetical protein
LHIALLLITQMNTVRGILCSKHDEKNADSIRIIKKCKYCKGKGYLICDHTILICSKCDGHCHVIFDICNVCKKKTLFFIISSAFTSWRENNKVLTLVCKKCSTKKEILYNLF